MKLDSVYKTMEKGVQEKVFPGSVLLVSLKSDIVFFDSFGVADLYTRERVETDTVFDLASLTKPLATTLALAKLFDQGLLCPDQRLGTIMKEALHTDKENITIDQLMRHVSGLPAHRPYYEKLAGLPWTDRKKRIEQMILLEPLTKVPGTCEIYSDLGFMLLGFVVEKITGLSLAGCVQKAFYAPLGLKNLFFVENNDLKSSDKTGQRRFAATEYCPWRKKSLKGEVHDENAWAAGGVAGHAGLFGTASDVWKLVHTIMTDLQGETDNIVKSKTLSFLAEKKNKGSRAAGFDTPSPENSSAGKFFSPLSLGHLGFTGTSFWMDPEKSIIVLLLTNRVHLHRSNVKIRQFRPVIHNLVMETLMDF